MRTEDKTNERPGWISLHRKSLESTVFQNMKVWYVWTWCLLKANFEDKDFFFNGKDITVKRGQFITGRSKALEELKDLTAQNFRTAIEYLKSTNRITTKVTNKFTIITVCKYDEYQTLNKEANQQFEQPLTNNQPTSNQQVTTSNNINKFNNYNKEEYTKFSKENLSPKVYSHFDKWIKQEKNDLKRPFNSSRYKKELDYLKSIPGENEQVAVIEKAIYTGCNTLTLLTQVEKETGEYFGTKETDEAYSSSGE
jgi:hypothetical protein